MISQRVKVILLAVSIYLLLGGPPNVKACTSFAVYTTNGIYYGLNLDWYNSELRFTINQAGGYKYFQLDFLESGMWLTSVGFNEHGYLMTSQVASPAVSYQLNPSDNPIDGGMFYYSTIGSFKSVDTMLDYLRSSNSRITQVDYISLHFLCASKDGSAAIVETGEDSNKITSIENNFIVMTNFNNYRFWGEPYTSVTGLGADRYQIAYEYINNNKDNFVFEDAVEVLKRSHDSSGSSRTRCSMVFSPNEQAVYIILQRDFNHIYKLSLETNIIETYSGFNNYFSTEVNADGITASQLNLLTDINRDNQREISNSFYLAQNYPNPFNPTTEIEFSISTQSNVSLRVFDLLGREVVTLINEEMSPGNYKADFDGSALTTGTYFYRLSAGEFIETKKMILVK